jgi:hypothetical protein
MEMSFDRPDCEMGIWSILALEISITLALAEYSTNCKYFNPPNLVNASNHLSYISVVYFVLCCAIFGGP